MLGQIVGRVRFAAALQILGRTNNDDAHVEKLARDQA